MKEKKRKWKESGTAERFPLNFINEQKERSPLQFLSGAFIAKPPLQSTKKTKRKSYYKGQIGKKQKNVTKRSKCQKPGKVNSGRRKILQSAKFLFWSFFFCFLPLFPSGF